MTDRDRVLVARPDAVCVSLDVFGHTDYLIRAGGRDLTGWCGTEDRAWALAARLAQANPPPLVSSPDDWEE